MTKNNPPIQIHNDTFRLELLPLGATMRRFEVKLANGDWRNIVLGEYDTQRYLDTESYLGMSVGRFANRIDGGRFVIDDTEYIVEPNEGANQLHGGPGGFHSRVWDVTGQGDDWAEFALTSPDGDQGFPGTLTVTARYEILADGVQVTYRAVTDAPTQVNLTTHPYFNLSGEGSGDTDSHTLHINASYYTPTRADLIPTGEILPVSGSALDFREGRLMGEAWVAGENEGVTRRGGFDHNFIIDGHGEREMARLTGPDGLSVRVVSAQPALQMYGGDHFDGSDIGTSGVGYQRRAGIALETQNFPDAPNHHDFPDTVLRPGDEYVSTTRWEISGAPLAKPISA